MLVLTRRRKEKLRFNDVVFVTVLWLTASDAKLLIEDTGNDTAKTVKVQLGDYVDIMDETTVHVLSIRGSQASIGINAPLSITVQREEYYQRQLLRSAA